MIGVVLTGSECTGKTTLAAALAVRYSTVWTPEAARGHAEARRAPLGFGDAERIARRHIAATEAAARRARDLLILDTDLVSTVVYSHHYYGACPAWIEREARERRAQLYLLLHPDVPWLPDPARDRGERREEMHALFRAALSGLGVRFVDIRGGWAEREAITVRAIETLLAPPGAARLGLSARRKPR